MKVRTPSVSELLNGESNENVDADTQTASTGGEESGSTTTAMSRDELQTAVKEGVTEALDEYELALEEETDDDSSSSGFSRLRSLLALVTTLGTVAAVVSLRRRVAQRRATDDQQEDDDTADGDAASTPDESTD